MKVVVIGGGFVGQLIQFAVPSARLLDWRKTPPTDHLETRVGPQYLWEPIPGCKSEQFEVTTLVDGKEPSPESILAYKTKIGKENDGGDWGLQFQHKMPGYVSYLPRPKVEYDRTVAMVDLLNNALGMKGWSTIDYDILINTIPLPAFLELLIVGPEYTDGFKSDPIFMYQSPAPTFVEGMTLDYLSDKDDPVYRRTSYGRSMFHESLQPMGSQAKRITPGKIHPHPESETLVATLQTYGCYSFGRFATWRPDELAHQTWKEIVDWKEKMAL